MAGLSAMPAQWLRGGVQFYRPLLEVSGSDIRDWLADAQIAYVTDPSNVDERYTRNRIRAQIMPALQATFPHFRDTFARSAAHAAQAQALLNEIAGQDLATVLRERDSLPLLKPLQGLGQPRQANALRYWLKSDFGVVPSAAQLRELQNQIAACSTRGHHIHIKVGDGFVQRKGAVLAWYNPTVLPL
jgi:tRNA(Ile)-lysidine synthase